MRVHGPSSIQTIRRFVGLGDVLCVLAAGPAAFLLRDPSLLEGQFYWQAIVYCGASSLVGLAMLYLFHLGKNIGDFVSIREVQLVVAVSLATTASTSLVLFVITRLDYVPRSLPPVYFLVLTGFMLALRVFATKRRELREQAGFRRVTNPEHVLLVGSNQLAWFYLRMVNTFDRGRTTIVGILDEDPALFGRSLMGHTVLAPPKELRRLVVEFGVHGVNVARVLIAANRSAGPEVWSEVEGVCRELSIEVEYLGDKLGIELEQLESDDPVAPLPPQRAYFRTKRVLDLVIAVAMVVVFLPILAVVAAGVAADIGWPVVFWQKRDGRHGHAFLIYKFRTLHAPFDSHGNFVEEADRTSRFGLFLRRTRLDELPQLWNVIVGDMAFVGPRPLLPVDQPPNSKLRFQVRPGLTGWAQIHGGQLVSAEDKGVLDDWYVENASFALDAKIILHTIATVVMGEKAVPLPNQGRVEG